MSRTDRRQPILSPDIEPLADGPTSEIYDYLAAGVWPETIGVLDDGRAIVEVLPRHRPFVAEELGDPLARPGFFILDDLPRCRIFASKAWAHDFAAGLPLRWAARKSLRTLIPAADLLDAIPDAAGLTDEQLRQRIGEAFPNVRGPSIQCNAKRIRAALKQQGG